MIHKRLLFIVVVVANQFVIRPALADPAAPVLAAVPVQDAAPARSSGPPVQSSASGTSRIGGKILVIAGGTALLAGTIMAVHYTKGIGECDSSGHCTQEDGRTPLGLGVATAGAIMAMVGACLWLSVPATDASVGMGPSSLIVAGRF